MIVLDQKAVNRNRRAHSSQGTDQPHCENTEEDVPRGDTEEDTAQELPTEWQEQSYKKEHCG